MVHAVRLNLNSEQMSSLFFSRHGCSLGESTVWRSLCFVWECILLVIAIILTFQSFNVVEELNETRYFAFMIYSHFFFLLLRLLAFILVNFDRISSATQLRIASVLVSCDTIAAIAIYFIPKFLLVMTPEKSNNVPKQNICVSQTPKGRRLISGVRIPAGDIPTLAILKEESRPASSVRTVLKQMEIQVRCRYTCCPRHS